MNKAIFLDRDGVLNREIGRHVRSVEEFKVLPDVAEALANFAKKGYLLIVITNQSAIAKGLFDHEFVATVHKLLKEELVYQGVHLKDIYYCPHYTEQGKCLCRKPGSMMIEKALAKYDINPSKSYMIGDKERDTLAGEAVGVRGVLIESNSSLLNVQID